MKNSFYYFRVFFYIINKLFELKSTIQINSARNALLIFGFLSSQLAIAQSQSVQVTIKAVAVYSTHNAKNEDEDYRFRIWFKGSEPVNCLGAGGTPNNWIGVDYTVVSNSTVDLNEDITLEVDAWEEDGCKGNCTYNDTDLGCDDGFHCGKSTGTINSAPTGVPTGGTSFRLYNLAPGTVSSNLITIYYCGGGYRVQYLVTYTMPTPAVPTVTFINPSVAPDCDVNRVVELSTSTSLKPGFNSQISYRWEYARPYKYLKCIPNPDYCGGPACSPPPDPNWVEPSCCIFDPEFCNESCTAPPDPNWVAPDCCSLPACSGYEEDYATYFTAIPGPGGITQANVNGGKLTVDIRSLPGFENLTQSISRNMFRVRAVANGSTSSVSDASTAVRIDPLPPTVSQPILTEASCMEKGTGKIILSNVAGVLSLVSDPSSSYGYVLRKGNNTAPCTPGSNGSPGDCLQAGSESGSFNGSSHTIGQGDAKKILAGQYTLLLTNPGGKYGVCYKPYSVNVSGITALSTNEVINAIACNGSSDGSIEVTIRDGDPSSVTYSLTKQGFNQEKTSNTANAKVTFTDLSADPYVLIVNDGNCSPEVNVPLSITEPKKVEKVEFVSTAATCSSPGNGSFSVRVKRSTTGTSVHTDYAYELFREGTSIGVVEKSENLLTWGSLAAGSYKLVVKEKGGADCNAYEQLFTINPPAPLQITNVHVQKVSCFNGNNGSISVQGAGGSGSYTFELSGAATASNTTGSFPSLVTGDYYVTVRNQIACDDYYTHTLIKVEQPELVVASITATDITCNDKNDGVLSSTVTGGVTANQPYDYTWQTRINGSWTDLSVTTATVSNRIEGDYRLLVQDENNCPATSNEVTITRPDEISISSVQVSDIRCFGEKGSIQVTASGGTAPLTFEYAPQASATYTPLTSSTPIGAGTYKIRVKDKNNCALSDDPNTYTLTTPTTALSFTENKATYNGFNISCFDGSNGEVTVSASGGNGSIYSGYSYQLDTRGFVTEPILNNINAGNHLVSVRDGRGCVVSKTLNFTQAPMLQTSTSLKKNVDCFGAATGLLELTVTGGAGNFRYQLGTAAPQLSNRFEGLVAGSYSFSILDVNDCATLHTDNVVNLHPAITGTTTINDVLCHQGNDGSIELSITGGAPAYTYELVGEGVQVNPVTQLKAGTYAIVVRDSKGCTYNLDDLNVGEPTALVIDEVSMQDIVCQGGTGFIDMTASGGTAPYQYQYAVSNSTMFTPFTATTPLTANTYTVRVRDAHSCLTEYTNDVLITNPPQPLGFSHQVSDYNGYNISCFGGDNGFITLQPTGGNGASYEGYEVAIDNKPFQPTFRIDRINFGSHTFSVRDGRGCVVSKDIPFTQSTNALTLSLTGKQDVACFYETTGSLAVNAQGGVGPYTYWLSPTNKQTSTSFAGLPMGDYTVTVHDKNECETTLPVRIQSIHPAFSLAFQPKNVNCFDGQDGGINLTVTGGVTPFTYQWKNRTETTSSLQNIRFGTYEVTVTDAANCRVTEKVEVTQPAEPLRISSLTTYSACYNQDNGSVTIEAKGGTEPYQYSINKGITFLSDATQRSATGVTDIVVKDTNGCTSTGTASVPQRNNRPEPNFLVSSKQNALDTLILTDVSVPRPDSIAWTFSSNLEVIDKNPWAPKIRFAEAGNYPVTMTSYFGDCAYTVTKTIFLQPFDPNRKDDKLPGVKPIQSLSVSPNPSTGSFTVSVTLNRKRNLSLMVYATTGNIVYQNKYTDVEQVDQLITVNNAANGLYLVRAITESDAKEVKVIINR
jgi:large repetitive protein